MSEEDYRKGYRDGFDDGYNKARQDAYKTVPVPSPSNTQLDCPVCGIIWPEGALGYVCSNPNCPSRVTCGLAIDY